MTDLASPPPEGSRRVRRAPVVAALVVLLAVALALGDPAPPSPQGPRPATDPVAMPPAGARSSAWYCTGGPLVSVEGADASGGEARTDGEGVVIGSDGTDVAARYRTVDETVFLTNLGDVDADARVAVVADGSEVGAERVAVPARAVVPVAVGDLTGDPAAGLPATIVEPFSDSIVVEHLVRAETGFAIGPCATEPATRWFFPAGTTLRGAGQWLSLFNPFGDDAIVDVALYTSEGRRVEPERLSGFVVPRMARVVVPIHDFARREETVSARVEVRTGRVVAEQSLLLDGVDGRSGVTLSLGAVAPAGQWVFTDGRRVDGSRRSFVVANPGEFDASVEVFALTEPDVAVEPLSVLVPGNASTVVEVGPPPDPADGAGDAGTNPVLGVPADVDYAVVLQSVTDQGVVAEDLASRTGTGGSGVEASLGVGRPARRWAFARSRFGDGVDTTLALVNPGTESVEVEVTLVTPDGPVVPESARGVEIGPRGRLTVALTDVAPVDAGIIVDSTGPIAVERLVRTSEGISQSPGVPFPAP